MHHHPRPRRQWRLARRGGCVRGLGRGRTKERGGSTSEEFVNGRRTTATRDKRYDDDDATWLPQNRCCCCLAAPPPSPTDERSSCGIFCHSSSSCLPLSSRVNPPFAKLGFFVFVAARKERDGVTPVIYWPGGQAKKNPSFARAYLRRFDATHVTHQMSVEQKNSTAHKKNVSGGIDLGTDSFPQIAT